MTDPDPWRPELLSTRLLAWFDRERRDLPWRNTRDPYAIWVSEVMLQQTRVDAVIPFYLRWMERFPTVESLARAEMDEVLAAWKGLGYYSRARNLRRAAELIVRERGGRIPRRYVELLRLPGVGEYTAGAVASIAFGEAVPAVDGNTRRVVARLRDIPRPGAARVRTLAASLLERGRPGDLNQALMELGALVCTPRAPWCPSCPLLESCAAARHGRQQERPLPRERPPVRSLDVAVAVLRSPRHRYFVVRRPEDGLLGGMWEFPGVEVEGGADPGAQAALLAAELTGRSEAGAADADAPPGNGRASTGARLRPLPPVRHRFTHREATYHPFLVLTDGEGEHRAGRWVDASELDGLPFPVAQQKIARRAAGAGGEGRGDDA